MSVGATTVQLHHHQPHPNPPPAFHLRLHDPLAAAPPPPPPQPLYRASSCDRHPDQPVTGFCADCLRERLEGLDAATRRAEKAKSGGAAGVLRSVFFRHTGSSQQQNPSSSSSSASAASSFLPELRRCKSFSGSSVLPPPASAFEPQRRSCDVRGRNTLWTLFHLDDKQEPPSYTSYIGCIEADRRNLGGGLGFPPVAPAAPVLESRVEEEDEEEEEEVEEEEEEEEVEEEFLEAQAEVESEDAEINEEEVSKVNEMRPTGLLDGVPVVEDELVFDSGSSKGRRSEEITEEGGGRPMKEHIDLDGVPPGRDPVPPKKPPPKDFKEIAGSFWLAASVFSKKLQKWRRKQKLKKQQQQHHHHHPGGGGAYGSNSHKLHAASAGATIRGGGGGGDRGFLSSRWSRRFRDTQSEFAEDVFGVGPRRSCDTDPRFSLDVGRMSLDAGRMSLDAGRMSFDDARYSFDEPRASWDGYLIGGGAGGVGGRSGPFPRLPPILSVIEDGPPVVPAVQRSDGLIPVEDDQAAPGGTLQTREYYDNTQRRRRSLDRSSSMRRPGMAAVAAAAVSAVESNNDLRPPPPPTTLSNGKLTPTSGGNDFLHHVQRFEKEFRDSNPSNTLARDDCSESFDSTAIPFSSYTDPGPGPKNTGLPPKKPRRWGKAWNIWGFIHWRSKGTGGGGGGGGNGVVGRSLSESWRDVRREGFGGTGSVLRSNSTVVGPRHSFSGSSSAGFSGSMRRSGGLDVHGSNSGSSKRRGDEFVLERNRSARFSPGRLDNGMLRFYLTPMRSGGGRRGGAAAAGKHMGSHSFTRNVLRLY